MKITQKSLDDLTLIITLNIERDDYAEKRKKNLNNYRRNADLKGFRRGMAPMSLIEKTHGKSAQLDAVNDVISDGLNNYINENKLDIIGEPLPNESGKRTDWENDEEFEVSFDIALAPKVELKLSEKDKIPYYEADINETEVEKYKSNLLKQYGTLQNTEAVEEDNFIIADLTQEAMQIEGTYIAVKSVGDKEIQNSLLGLKPGEEISIDVNKAFENETDRAALLKVKKEELASLDPVFTLRVKEVKRYIDAEIGQELFDSMFGKDVVTTEEQFNAKIKERLEQEYVLEGDYRFMLDTREVLIEKAAILLPEDFLKRWLYTVNEGKFSMEEIEKDFPIFLKDFRWQLIRQYITNEQKLTVTRENLLDHARKVASYQFASYGLNNVPAEQLDKYAESLLANEKEGKRIYEKVEDDLVVGYVRSVVTLDKKSISTGKLHEMNM